MRTDVAAERFDISLSPLRRKKANVIVTTFTLVMLADLLSPPPIQLARINLPVRAITHVRQNGKLRKKQRKKIKWENLILIVAASVHFTNAHRRQQQLMWLVLPHPKLLV